MEREEKPLSLRRHNVLENGPVFRPLRLGWLFPARRYALPCFPPIFLRRGVAFSASLQILCHVGFHGLVRLLGCFVRTFSQGKHSDSDQASAKLFASSFPRHVDI
jgi:hypothetical protein